MRWKHINLKTSIWKIPADQMKNDESITIPLAGQVIEILEQRKVDTRQQNMQSPFVFPGSGSKGHLADPKKAWKRILKCAGIEDLRIHDLRRTLGSWQAATGANSYIIGKSLGHKSQQATAIYARLNIDPVRESVDKATDAMLLAMRKPDMHANNNIDGKKAVKKETL